MMKKTAVLFVLIFTFLISISLFGCGTGQSAGADATHDNAPQGGAPNTAPGNAVIPDTNESAVSEWGVADAPAASSPGDNAVSSSGSAPGNPGNPGISGNPEASGNNDTPEAASFSRVIVDREDLFFAIKEVRGDDALGYVWKMYIENRTDKNLMFSFEKVAVNDVMCDPFWAEVIAAGKKGNCEITWMRDALKERQISEVEKVDFTLNVYNDDDYREAPLMHDPFTIYPLIDANGAQSESNSAAEQQTVTGIAYDWQPSESDQILVDNDDCRIVVTDYDPDNSWGYAVHLYLCNKTDRDLIFSVENTSINGIMCEPYWAEIVTAGKSAISTILWDKTALNESEIKEVKEITLPMRVYCDSNIADLYVEETFILAP